MKDEMPEAAIVIRLLIRDGTDTAFFGWQARTAAAAAARRRILNTILALP
jgi:hypothetical protein